MMDTLISGFAEEHRRHGTNGDIGNTNRAVGSNIGSFTNKLSKFTLATFDDEGR